METKIRTIWVRDWNHDYRTISKTVYRHRLGTSQKEDELIFEEKSEIYTVSFGLTSDEKWHLINSSDHNSDEIYYFDANNKKVRN